MSLTLLTAYSPSWKELTEITFPNWQEYARRHNYTIIAREKPDKPEKFYGWLRMEDLYDYAFLYELAETFVVLDADIFFTNHSITFESLMDEDHDFYITEDVNGLNVGAMIFRASAWCEKVVTMILDQRKRFDGEQQAIRAIIPQFMDRTKILPQSSMNSYLNSRYPESVNRKEGNWAPRDLLLHLPALPFAERVKIFTDLRSALATQEAA